MVSVLAIVGREQGYARRAAHASIIIPNQDPKLVTPLSELSKQLFGTFLCPTQTLS